MNKLGDLSTLSQGLANVNLGLLNIHVSYFTSKVRDKYYATCVGRTAVIGQRYCACGRMCVCCVCRKHGRQPE